MKIFFSKKYICFIFSFLLTFVTFELEARNIAKDAHDLSFYSIYGEDYEDDVDAREIYGDGGRATPPECGRTITDILILIGSLYAGYSLISYGIKLVKAPSIAARVAGSAMISSGVAAIVTILVVDVHGACLFSFVRDPVLHNEAGEMLKKDNVEQTTDNYYEAQPSAYSDWIRICLRRPTPFFGSGGCHDSSISKNYEYDGATSYLCPEEWRAIGFKRESANVNKAFPIEESSRYSPELAEMKLDTGPVQCNAAVAGDNSFNLHGYRYRAIKIGGKVCGQIIGIGNLNTPSRLIVGCHFSTPPPPAPMCDASIPIRKDSDKDENGNNIPGTGEGDIIAYENSKCFSCYISQWCNFDVNILSKSVLPISAPFIHCFKESMDLVMNGCRDGETGQRKQEGFLYVAQQSIKTTINVVIALSIFFISLSIVFNPGNFKKGSIMGFFFKSVLVLYLTTSVDSDSGGMQTLSSAVYSVANKLSSIMLDAGATNGLCVFNDDDYYYDMEVMGPDGEINIERVDFSYLKLWDSIDCRFYFYLGGNLIKSSLFQEGQIVFLGLAIIFAPLALIFTSLEIIPAAALVCVFVFCGMTVIWASLIMLLSIVGSAITILVSPIFIPMYLFSYTKSFFDEWLKEFIGYHLMPIIIMAFMGFLFNIYDDLFFGNAKFKEVTAKIMGKNVAYFALDDEWCDKGTEGEDCYCRNNKIGCRVAGFKFVTRPIIFGIMATKISGPTLGDLYLDAAIAALITFLLVLFLANVPPMCGELSGGARSLMYIGGFVKSPIKIGGSLKDQIAKLAKKLSKAGAGKGSKKTK